MSLNDTSISLSKQDMLDWEQALKIWNTRKNIKECVVYVWTYSDNGNRLTCMDTMMLNLDESVEDQIYKRFPDIEGFSWYEVEKE